MNKNYKNDQSVNNRHNDAHLDIINVKSGGFQRCNGKTNSVKKTQKDYHAYSGNA